MNDPWAEWDAQKIGNPPWGPIPLPPEQKAIHEQRWNPLGVELPEGWTYDRAQHLYCWADAVLSIRLTRSSDGFFRVYLRFGDQAVEGHGLMSPNPDDFPDYLKRKPAMIRHQFRHELKRLYGTTATALRYRPENPDA